MTDAERKMVQELITRQNDVEELALMAQRKLIICTLLKLEKEILMSDDVSVIKAAGAEALEEAVRRIKELGEDSNGSDKQSKVENVS